MQIPGPQIGYIDYLDIATEDAIAADDRVFNPLRPSNAGACERELGYQYMEYKGLAKFDKEPLAASQKRIFDMGHSVEYHVLKQFSHVLEFKTVDRQQSILVTPLSDGSWVKGSMDCVFWSEEWKCVADIKSKKDKFSKFYSTNWGEFNQDLAKFEHACLINKDTDRIFWIEDLPKFLDELYEKKPNEAPWLEANFLQLNLYAFGEYLVTQGVDHAAIIQYNKNDSRMRELRFRPSKDLQQNVIERFQFVDSIIMQDKTVDKLNRDFTLGTPKCAFCDYKKECRPGTDPLKEWFNTFPPKRWPKDTDRLKQVGDNLEYYYAEWKKAQELSTKGDYAIEQILKILEKEKIKKVRFKDKMIYEVKHLKTPRPHLELRRTKL